MKDALIDGAAPADANAAAIGGLTGADDVAAGWQAVDAVNAAIINLADIEIKLLDRSLAPLRVESRQRHALTNELSDIDFTVLAITMHPYLERQYALAPNVRNVITVPLWGTEDSAEYGHHVTAQGLWNGPRYSCLPGPAGRERGPPRRR